MLSKVLNIEGVGLLRDVKGGNKTPFRKVTLIYAENGRGKSTFASLLSSCTNRDAELVEDRVTIDAEVQPTAKLMFGSAQATYKDGAWDGYQPDIIVYDGNFVNDNVHTGLEVTPNQRANLLDFALGVSAVQARADETRATEREQIANQSVKHLKARLQSLVADAMPVPQFRALVEDSEIDRKITDAEHRHAAIERSAEIKRQPVPQEMVFPALDLDEVFTVLNGTLASVHAKAAAKVTEHLGHLSDANSAAWLQQGLELSQSDSCPFCGQDVSQVELLEMYRVYFDSAYADLQRTVQKTSSEVLSAVDPELTARLQASRIRNNEIVQQWEEYVPIRPLEGEGDDLARASLENLRDLLESLFGRKTAAITEATGSDNEAAEVKRLWEQAKAVFDDENVVIRGYRESIESYKQSLDATSIEASRADLVRLRAVKLRFADATEKIIAELKVAESNLKNAEREKKTARDALNVIMVDTLSKFKDDINYHLDEFNTDFRINEFSHNYRGKSPRVEYGIQLRGEAIELAGGRPTFATALSEGDKKTMGFAFFAASTLADPNLHNKIVVIDDPMSSLDAPRRDHTTEVIEKIIAGSEQVILMAHDEHFLRGMRERLSKQNNAPQIGQAHLRMATKRYSDFGDLDLDVLCQSPYLADYRLVTDVVEGIISDPEGVARGAVALRPLLEGYLHRKYPGVIPTGVTLGKAITAIEDAAGTDSPCAAMSDRVDDLRRMNDYASKFHHNTHPDIGAAKRENQATVVKNGDKILSFIHSA